jgi:DNA-binding transcriptional ArsR family regulator
MLRPKMDAGGPPGPRAYAPVFSALGDETRLILLGKLCRGEPQSISELSEGSKMTRQAITKHLRVLERASLVRGSRRGREMRYGFAPRPIEGARQFLGIVSQRWDEALARLKSLVESGPEKSLK